MIRVATADELGPFVVFNIETNAALLLRFDDENDAQIYAAGRNSGLYACGRIGLFIVMREDGQPAS